MTGVKLRSLRSSCSRMRMLMVSVLVLMALSSLAHACAVCEPVGLDAIPDKAELDQAPDNYEAIFEVSGDRLVGKWVRKAGAGELGLACWSRIVALFPAAYREGIVQFNVISGRKLAGAFSGNGENDVERDGYSFSVAHYTIEEDSGHADPTRAVTPRRGTLDWTLVHEIGHYICLRTNAIEHFSQMFDGDSHPQPVRRENPDDYPEDGSPVLAGNFVTSYAERTPGDEEVVETFTTYMLVVELPNNGSLVARKIMFFEVLPGFRKLRDYVQSVGEEDRPALNAMAPAKPLPEEE